MKLVEEKKRNRNAMRSKRLLIEAYTELIQTVPAEKITVTAVVERAELNRSTFYAHFNDVDDIAEYIFSNVAQTLSEMMEALDCRRILSDPLPLLLKVSEFIEERKVLYAKIVKLNPSGRLMHNLKEILIEYLARDIKTVRPFSREDDFYINLRFFAGGYFSLCNDWLRGNLDMTLTDISKVIARTIQAGTVQYAKKSSETVSEA